ncbi:MULTISPECIES: extracellular catalytic domain type 1 short-chain-length polyhydroxyalkanoate depolymerase [unclassified Methylobacterium]|jgi:poly(hydroxyalkanoate) depolymerase family esterase|uniref:extracellular catalytic domain type 1 short-chain-length polyhydroxyalkanoate depolymerase n=1 Tax=unclassified Methylobacterium TaxID=2615210 RepID=UPI0013526E82|nr:PHB depolymerase family esterase [Methylobacterium sp. 2A]MWV23358.1 PHB depolymerase family esterase [Methylobacterium sp. 2A]
MTDDLGSHDGEPTRGSGASPWADLIEATRLTGLGRLDEATALIQRSLGGAPQARREAAAPEAHPVPARDPAESGPRVREVVEQVVRGLAPVLKGLGKPLRQPAPPADPSGPPGGRFVALSHTEAAGSRDYKLFIPSRPDARAPLVVMLHGCTQNPDDFAAGTGMNILAERAGVFVAYPAQSRQAHAQRCWNWYDPRDQARGSGEPAIIAGLTRAIMAEHPIDPARVYIAGLSAGGAAALNIARAYPDLYAAVGVHSGLAAGCARDLGSALMAMQVGAPGLAAPMPFGAPAAATRVPTIVFHGEDDGTVSVRNADQVLAQANVAGLTARSETIEGRGHPFTRTRYRDSSGRVVVEDWRVRGAGHAWSGGHPEGSYTDRDGPDASRAMLDFFAEHRLGPKRR